MDVLEFGGLVGGVTDTPLRLVLEYLERFLQIVFFQKYFYRLLNIHIHIFTLYPNYYKRLTLNSYLQPLPTSPPPSPPPNTSNSQTYFFYSQLLGVELPPPLFPHLLSCVTFGAQNSIEQWERA